MKDFWNVEELKQIHIELTNACNAACPMCVRFYHNSTLIRPDLKLNQITLDKFKKYFPPHIIKQCKLFLLCGVHGDPIMAKDVYEICKYIEENSTSKTALQMHTNGGVRDIEWWNKLGELFSKRSKKNVWRVIFSIDGLEDTNHIYRRNVNWKKLMDNAQTYIDAGGVAIWEYLIFKHNEHQLELAEKTALELGFKKFIPKRALGVDDGVFLNKMQAINKNGDLEHVIEAPTKSENRNLPNPQGEKPFQISPINFVRYEKIKNEGNEIFKNAVENSHNIISKKDYSKQDSCNIKCKSKSESGGKEIFVDNFGRVMPCCYIGTHLNGTYGDDKTLQLHKVMNDYGWEHFSLEHNSLEEILENGHLDRVFADSWSKDKIANGKLLYCSETCGQESQIDRIYQEEEQPRKFSIIKKFIRRFIGEKN